MKFNKHFLSSQFQISTLNIDLIASSSEQVQLQELIQGQLLLLTLSYNFIIQQYVTPIFKGNNFSIAIFIKTLYGNTGTRNLDCSAIRNSYNPVPCQNCGQYRYSWVRWITLVDLITAQTTLLINQTIDVPCYSDVHENFWFITDPTHLACHCYVFLGTTNACQVYDTAITGGGNVHDYFTSDAYLCVPSKCCGLNQTDAFIPTPPSLVVTPSAQSQRSLSVGQIIGISAGAVFACSAAAYGVFKVVGYAAAENPVGAIVETGKTVPKVIKCYDKVQEAMINYDILKHSEPPKPDISMAELNQQAGINEINREFGLQNFEVKAGD